MFLSLFQRSVRSSSSVARLKHAYDITKSNCNVLVDTGNGMDPRAVFANNELHLKDIEVEQNYCDRVPQRLAQVYGFDYDYTLAVYKRELNELIYSLALNRLITQFKYPEALLQVPYDLSFAIRGLHFDVANSCLLKVDAFSQVQKGTVYRGKDKLADEIVKTLYPGYCLPDVKGRDLPQLIDLFSLPWAGLLSTVIHYCDANNIVFGPKSLYDDLAECVRQVHVTGEMYHHIGENLPSFVHPNEELKEYLEMLYNNGKELFVVTNSPFRFINYGMTYMLGTEWRKYFTYIVVSAKKPAFFFRRIYDHHNDVLSFEKVNVLEKGMIYAGGNIDELSNRAGYHEQEVLYFGDHIYTDLADPMLRLGWHTAAVVPELAKEIRTQNSFEFRNSIMWLEALTGLIEKHQVSAVKENETKKVMNEWNEERNHLREMVKSMFNRQFGSMFRTYNNMTYFSRRLNSQDTRLFDYYPMSPPVYTSRVPNFLKYGVEHSFFPRRNALPHESVSLTHAYHHEEEKRRSETSSG